MSIYFNGDSIQMQIPGIQHNPGYKVSDMYSYLQQSTGIESSLISLIYDGGQMGQIFLHPQDSSPIPFQANSTLYIIQYQPQLAIFLDSQSLCQTQTQNTSIGNLLQYLVQEYGIQIGQYYQIDFYDENNQPLFLDVDINEYLYTYTNHYLNVIMNIQNISQQQYQNNLQQKQQQQGFEQIGESNLKVQSQKYTNIGAYDLLQSLILLKNISLLIDPNGQFVVYKFHFPTLIQGYLEISKGKEGNIQAKYPKGESDFWIKKNNVSYAEIDDYGFVIRWSDGKVNSLRIKQQ